MNGPRPVASCICGYSLLQGQTCPECGRPFDETITHALTDSRPSAGCLPLAGVAGLLWVSIVGLLCISGTVYPNSAYQAAFAVMLPATWMWYGALVLTGLGLFVALPLFLLRKGNLIRAVSLAAAIVGAVAWAGLMVWGILGLM